MYEKCLSLAYRQSVRCPETGHKIESYSSEYQEEKQRENYGKPGDQGIIPGMIKPESLQHAPETVTKMNRQSNEPKDVEKSIEKIAQQLFYGNRDENGFGRKGETKDMDNKKCKKKQTGVGHGFRGE